MKLIRNNIEITVILLLGFILRLTSSLSHSYTNDELSAISRLRYNEFGDLLQFGVMEGDMHPAGVQVFMKLWSVIGETGELWMRLPFILCGVASIWIIYVLGWKWFKNKNVGLIAAVLLCFLYFPVLHSELARPYSPGLLIILLVAWFYHKVLFCHVKKYSNAILLGLAFASAMYTHYFAFLFVGFIGLSGLFFLNKENIKYYAVATITGIVLFLPHLDITLYHLSVGGLQWLGPPDWNWLFEFIKFAFNDSMILLGVIFISLLLSLKLTKKTETIEVKYLILCITWFFGIYIVGHIFSLVSSPILKFPVMLFALPFLLLLLAYLLSRFKFDRVLVLILGLVTLSSTIFEKDLYGNRHYGIFKEIAEHVVAWNEEFGDENVVTVFNVNNPEYLNYYARQIGDPISFECQTIEFGDDMLIREMIMSQPEKYCALGYSARRTSPQIYEMVREFYPILVEYEKFNNSAVFLLKKGVTKPYVPWNEFAFEVSEEEWNYNSDLINKDSIGSYYLLGEEEQYGPTLNFKLNEIEDRSNVYIKVEVDAEIPIDGQLTITFSGERNGGVIQYRDENFWMGHDIETFKFIPEQEMVKGYFAFNIPEHLRDDDNLKISLWNRNGKLIKIRRFKIFIVDNIWN